MEKYYLILEIKPGATKEEIKKSFRRLAHIHHPDKGGDAEIFKKMSEAYNELMKDNSYADFGHHSGSYSSATVYTYNTSTGDVNNFWYGTTMEDVSNAMDEFIKSVAKRQEELNAQLRKQDEQRRAAYRRMGMNL